MTTKASARKLIDLPREYLIIMMEAGYVFLTMNRLEAAKQVFQGMCHLTPKSEVPRIALGNLYYNQTDLGKALREFQKALKIKPKSALAQAHIGEIFLMQGQVEKALPYLHEAIKIDRRGSSGKFARALLDAVEKGVLPDLVFNYNQVLKEVEKHSPKKPSAEKTK